MKKSAILLLLLFAALAAGAQPFYRKPVAPVRNVIVMIPDGTSTSVLAAARWYKFYNDLRSGRSTSIPAFAGWSGRSRPIRRSPARPLPCRPT